MTVKLLVFMTMLQLALSVPDPDPDPVNNININVKQVVNAGGCCPEPNPPVCTFYGLPGICSKNPEPPFIIDVGDQQCEDEYNCYVEGCKFGDDVYADGAYAQDTCMVLNCVKGVWNYTGKIEDCGECQLFGDPHIFTYDEHKGQDPAHYYGFMDSGIFTVTQGGLSIPAEYGLSAIMEECYGVESCVRGINYFEPGIEINITLPSFDDTDCYPEDDEAHTFSPANVPGCMPKVYVNEKEYNFESAMGSFDISGGTVLLFPHNHQGNGWDSDGAWLQWYGDEDRPNIFCINIVGSTGLSASLCTSIKYWYSNLYVWATPTLRGVLYGLCGEYTGGVQDGYTMQNGSLTNDTELFGSSWMTYENDHSGGLPNLNKCTNARVLQGIEVKCDGITEDVCKIVPAWQCAGFIAACVYDLCRSTDSDLYAEAYTNHLAIHSSVHG